MTELQRCKAIHVIDTLDLIQKLTAVPDTQDAMAVYQQFLSQHGYEHFTYGCFLDATQFLNHEDVVYVSNHSADVEDVFETIGLEHDVSTQHCFSHQEPFWWRDPEPIGPRQPCWSKMEKEFIGRCEDVRLKNGVSIPLHTSERGRGVITLARAYEEPDADHRSYWRTHSRELILSAWVFHMSVDKSLVSRSHCKLTVREVDALAYLASGFSQQQAAAKLNINIRTIETRLIRARKKLGANTTLQAVVRAVRRGIV